MAAATPQHFRIASRRAQSLLEKHLASKRPPSSSIKKSPPKSEETSWPKSIRYTFYAACVAAVPFSIGSVIAMSPRLRNSLEDDTNPDENGFTSNNLVHLVRQYWGTYDYIPPTDRVQIDNILPGRKMEWQDDNWSSFLAFLGLYTPKDEQSNVAADSNGEVPISLQNEPPANERYERTLLARFLSPEYNPAGVKVRLLLLPYETFGGQGISRHEFELSLPSNTPLTALRNAFSVSSTSDAIQKIKNLFPGVSILESDAQSIDLSGTYRCVLDFNTVSGDENLDVDGSIDFTDSLSTPDKSLQPSAQDVSKMILSNTSSHSSWTYFPDTNTASSTKVTPSKFNASTEGSTNHSSSQNVNSARIEQLNHQISTLQKELSDPSSLRDRDDMYAELKAAKRELNSLKPWYKRLLG